MEPTFGSASSAGFHMPAEWERHANCYVSWPCREATWHGHFVESKAAYVQVIKAISRFEPVCVLATSSTTREAQSLLGVGVKIIEMDLDDSWLRDNGPIFVRNLDDQVAIVKFKFNGWGGKFPPYDKDDHAPIALAKQIQMGLFASTLVLEGGSISVDGEGTLLTTEQCLLNRNRNPHLTRGQIEQNLADNLGVRHVIWLGKGVEEDVTDGHVDGVACFAKPRLVIAAHTKDRSDPNFATLEDNIDRLGSATDSRGRSLEVIRMIQPRPREVDGIHITPGYTNHYLANGGVIMPTYGISEDKKALDILQSAYPDRQVVGVDCTYIEIGGGAVHCITQQRPAGAIFCP